MIFGVKISQIRIFSKQNSFILHTLSFPHSTLEKKRRNFAPASLLLLLLIIICLPFSLLLLSSPPPPSSFPLFISPFLPSFYFPAHGFSVPICFLCLYPSLQFHFPILCLHFISLSPKGRRKRFRFRSICPLPVLIIFLFPF